MPDQMESKQESILTKTLERLASDRADEEAWKQLHRQMWPYILALTYRTLRGARELAEDASQEVFIRLVRYCNFQNLQHPQAFRMYVRAIALNVCRNYIRQYARYARLEEHELDQSLSEDTSRSQPSTEEEVESRQLLEDMLAKLDLGDKEIVTLLLEGYALPEISAKTHLSYSNTAVRLHRIRQKLRNYLQENETLCIEMFCIQRKD